MPLTSAPISQQETERKAVELLDEFYRLFLTGEAVAIAGVSQTLPKCDLCFGVASPGQPLTIPQVHTIFSDWKEKATFDGPVKRVFAGIPMQVYVRAGNQSGATGHAEHVCRRVADALKQIFQSEKHLLARKGFQHVTVRKGPVPLPTVGVAVRMLLIDVELQYHTAV